MAEETDKKETDKENASAEGAAGAEVTEALAKKKSKQKMMIIVAVVAVLIVVLGGGGAAFYLSHAKAEKTAQQAEGGDSEKAKHVYFQLGDMLVNLSGEGKHPNFLKVKITLELTDEKDLPLMEAIKPRIIDNFQVYLRELRIEDLRGSAGMYRLHEEMLMRVTEAAQPIRVRDVLFQEMLVQ